MSCYITLFHCLLDLRCGDCNVLSLYLCVALLMDLFVLCVACLTVFVNSAFVSTVSSYHHLVSMFHIHIATLPIHIISKLIF